MRKNLDNAVSPWSRGRLSRAIRLGVHWKATWIPGKTPGAAVLETGTSGVC